MLRTSVIAIVFSLIVTIPAWGSVNDDLFDAARKGDLARVEELIDNQGANVNASDQYGGTALMFAAVNGHLNVVQKLIASGADVNREHNFGKTAKMLAEEKGHTAVVQELVNAGATH